MWQPLPTRYLGISRRYRPKTHPSLMESGLSIPGNCLALKVGSPRSRQKRLDRIVYCTAIFAALISAYSPRSDRRSRERIRAGIAEARLRGEYLGRPVTVGKRDGQIGKLYRDGIRKAEIARRLDIGRTSVRRILTAK